MILVAGEALFDVFVGGATSTGFEMDARIGGSPLNVAIGLARLGRPVAFLGGIGAGALGDRLVDAMAVEGVDTSPVQRIQAPTTLGLVAIDGRGVPDYAFYGEGAADRCLVHASLKGVAGLKALHVGSYSTVVGATADTLAQCVADAPEGCVVSYDPNVRLNVEPSIAAWRQRLAWMLPRTDFLKISEEDLLLLEPGTTPEDFVARGRRHGVGVVIVTRGADGAVGGCATGMTSIPASLAGPLVDTVGAGDTYQAALLTWLDEQGLLSSEAMASLSIDALAAAMRFAAVAAGVTCTRRGANLPRRSEVQVP